MTFIERYLNGETKEVYEEIYALGDDAFSVYNFQQIDLVLKETFRRTAYNLAIIYQALKDNNYHFKSDIKYDWQRPLLAPIPNTDQHISTLRSRIGDKHLPLSLQYFYTMVGSCNFCWDWETKPDIPWEGADPIDIPPIDALLEMVDEEMEDGGEILIAGDYLQKDNISGSSYSIELTDKPTVDSQLLHDYWNIPFIEYLRTTFHNCGFSMADCMDYKDLDEFCDIVRPLLKRI